jgi:PAS domain S-box-containing protein
MIMPSLVAALDRFGQGEHLCSIYETQAEDFAVSVPFLRIGLERRERCLYIADEGGDDDARAAMAAGGIEVERHIRGRMLIIATRKDTSFPPRLFDPDSTFEVWREMAIAALRDGFSGVRVVGDAARLPAGIRGLEREMAYESGLTDALVESRCTALCRYDRRLFSAEVILEAIRAHPIVAYHSTVGRNMYHVPPEEFLETSQAVQVERLLTNIRDRGEIEGALRRQLNELRRSDAYLDTGQRISGTGSWAWNVSSGELFWSREHFRIFGRDPDSSTPSHQQFLQMIHPDDRANVEEAFAAAVRGRADFDADYRILRGDGTIRYLHSVAHPLFDAGDPVREYVGTVIDVTERRLDDEAVRATQAELERVARMMTLGELTASIAHEVNQPLTAVVASAQACLRWLAAGPPNVHEMTLALERMIRAGNRAGAVIDRIRALATKRTGREMEPLDLNQVIEEVTALTRGELRRHVIPLRCELAGNLPHVLGDRVQLQQVVLNLLMNAIEATAGVDGRPAEILVRTQNDSRDQVRVVVRDAGVGLDAQSLDRVFDAFYSTKPQGMGIGLSISRSIVESHGGKLWAAQNNGPGATFSFTLPSDPNV